MANNNIEDSIINMGTDECPEGGDRGDSADGNNKADELQVNVGATCSNSESSASMDDILSTLRQLTKVLTDRTVSERIDINNNGDDVEECEQEESQYAQLLDEDEEECDVAEPINSSVKHLVEERSTGLIDESLFTSKLKKTKKPANVDICTPKVNPEVWRSLSAQSKQKDKRYICI